MLPFGLSFEIIVILGVLTFTVFLFVSEIVRVDLAAILVMVLLGALSYLPGLEGIIDVNSLFDGFASNAVISIIAVMIVGAGLDRTGIMSRVAATILRFGGTSEKRIIPIVSGTAGVISGFMQNVGAASLFLPVVSRISARSELPLGRLLMPMGFCAILGGTMTMVGSSPLILLNDLIISTNRTLPDELKMETFHMFSVTPVGFALVLTGILYFVLFGRWVLPGKSKRDEATTAQSMKDYVKRLYGLKADIFEVVIPEGHLLVGQTLADMMEAYHLYIIGTYHHGQKWLAPPVDTTIVAPCRLAVLGRRKVIQEITDVYDLRIEDRLKVFNEDFSPTQSGIAEIVIPPNSRVIGKTARDLLLRKTFGLNLLAIHRIEETLELRRDRRPPGHDDRQSSLSGRRYSGRSDPVDELDTPQEQFGLRHRHVRVSARRGPSQKGWLGTVLLSLLDFAHPVHRRAPFPLSFDGSCRDDRDGRLVG